MKSLLRKIRRPNAAALIRGTYDQRLIAYGLRKPA